MVEEIIARINNQNVTRTENLAQQRSVETGSAAAGSRQRGQDRCGKNKDVLRDLIDQQLLLDKGKDLGITADTEVIRRFDEMRKEMKLESMEDLEKAAVGQGISF